MSWGCFTEKKITPTPEEIEAALGEAKSAWDALAEHLRTNYTVTEGWKFLYGKKYGWALHFERERKMLANLYPNREEFTVQINLPESAVRATLEIDLNDRFRAAIEGAFPFPEGRWIFIPCRSESDLPALFSLVKLRVASRLDKKGRSASKGLKDL